jgi:hypothetical protein
MADADISLIFTAIGALPAYGPRSQSRRAMLRLSSRDIFSVSPFGSLMLIPSIFGVFPTFVE